MFAWLVSLAEKISSSLLHALMPYPVDPQGQSAFASNI